jgi:hypothetical protein
LFQFRVLLGTHVNQPVNSANAGCPCCLFASLPQQHVSKYVLDLCKLLQIVIAKLQRIAFNHFLPTLGVTEASVKRAEPLVATPDISTEFATAAYRFGHDFIPDKLGSFATVDLFDGERFFLEQDEASVTLRSDAEERLVELLRAVATSKANQVDGKLSDTLRNTLFGAFGEDLASRNIFRGRDVGLVDYADIAKCYGTTPDSKVSPPFAAIFSCTAYRLTTCTAC